MCLKDPTHLRHQKLLGDQRPQPLQHRRVPLYLRHLPPRRAVTGLEANIAPRQYQRLSWGVGTCHC